SRQPGDSAITAEAPRATPSATERLRAKKRPSVVSIVGLFFLFLLAIWLLVNFFKDPSDFLNIFLIGLTRGCVYALVALGYTLVYGILQLINFAHGDVFALCGLVAATVMNTVLGVSEASSNAYFW